MVCVCVCVCVCVGGGQEMVCVCVGGGQEMVCVCVGGGQEMVCVCVGGGQEMGTAILMQERPLDGSSYDNNNRKVVSLCSCPVPIHMHDCHSKNWMSVLHMFHTNWISAILPHSENT